MFFWNVYYIFSIVFNKTGSFNSFLFIYLTVINWVGNTRQRNLRLRFISVFILHQCFYLNKTAVLFVMRTKGYDFIIEKKIQSTVFATLSNIVSNLTLAAISVSHRKRVRIYVCLLLVLLPSLPVNGISISSLFLLFDISRYMLLCICRKRRFLYIVVKPAN